MIGEPAKLYAIRSLNQALGFLNAEQGRATRQGGEHLQARVKR